MQPTVLQILPSLDYGGVERGTVEIANELVRRKHKSIVMSANGRLVPELTASGTEHIDLPVGEKSIISIRLIPKIYQFLEERQVDIVHVRSRMPAWLTHFALKKIHQKKRPILVSTVHGPYSVNPYSKIMMSGSRIIAISEYIKKYILNNYPDINENKIEVIPRGVNNKEYHFDYKPENVWIKNWYEEFPHLQNKFLITLPARLTRWKGQNDFIEIITKLNAMGINVHGLIVGGIDKRKKRYFHELKSLIKKNNIEDCITLTNHRDDIKDILSISNIVLSLAKIPEAFGRTALEALSLGVPVVAYDHGGAKEVLEDLFPEGKTEPLNTKKAVSLIKKFYESMPEVKNKNIYTLDNMLDKTISIYNSFYL